MILPQVLSGQTLPFPPCTSLDRIEVMEWLAFYCCPHLTSFVRETTPFERGVGIEYTHAFISRNEGKITRLYGSAISLS